MPCDSTPREEELVRVVMHERRRGDIAWVVTLLSLAGWLLDSLLR